MKKKYLIATIIVIILAIMICVVSIVSYKQSHKEQQASDESELSVLEEVEQEPEETFDLNTFDVSQVDSFTYVSGDQLAMFGKEEGVWKSLNEDGSELDPSKVESFLTEVSEIQAMERFENVEDTSVYGLDQSIQMFVAVLEDGSSLTYLFGLDEYGNCYAQITNDVDETHNHDVYRVDHTTVISTLAKTMDDFK